MAYELGPRGIRVNALSPGPLDTLSSRAIHGYVDMKRVQAERSPLQRNITHDEVGKAALFLLSDLSSGITGHIPAHRRRLSDRRRVVRLSPR